MNCGHVQPKLADYSVGLLRARERDGVRDHLATCEACGREWRQLQAVLGAVERYGSREPPPHLWNGVYNRITAGPAPAAPGFRERWIGVRNRWIAGLATGLAGAALCAGFYFHQPPVPGPASWPPAPTAPALPQRAMVQQHAMLAGFEPFADEVGLEAYARLVNDPNLNAHSSH